MWRLRWGACSSSLAIRFEEVKEGVTLFAVRDGQVARRGEKLLIAFQSLMRRLFRAWYGVTGGGCGASFKRDGQKLTEYPPSETPAQSKRKHAFLSRKSPKKAPRDEEEPHAGKKLVSPAHRQRRQGDKAKCRHF